MASCCAHPHRMRGGSWRTPHGWAPHRVSKCRTRLPARLLWPFRTSDLFAASCRKGVCQGNYAEELLAADAAGRPFVLDRGAGGAPFQGQSTTAATYTPAGGRRAGCSRPAMPELLARSHSSLSACTTFVLLLYSRGGTPGPRRAPASWFHAHAASPAGSAGKSGSELAAVAQREDIRLKYVKYGRSAVLPEDKTGFWASTAQLAYGQFGRCMKSKILGQGGVGQGSVGQEDRHSGPGLGRRD